MLISLISCAAVTSVRAEESAADEAHRTYLETLRKEKRYPTAISCSQCHPDHFEEWSVSPHSYAMLSPVFNSMHTFITKRTAGTNGDFCIRCHTPVGMEREEDIYGSVLMRSPAVREGVTCITCHRVSKDFGTTSGRIALEAGPITDSIYGPGGNQILQDSLDNPELGLITDENERGKLVHEEVIKSPVIAKSGQCGMCHDVNSPNGIRLESAFTEFKHSPAAKEGTSCQDCHMGVKAGAVLPKEERYSPDGRDLNYAFAPAARIRNSPRDPGEGVPTEPRKRTNHMFIGPDYSIVHPGVYPHSLAASEFTYGTRFRETLSEQSKDLVAYLKSLPKEPSEEALKEAELEGLRIAARSANQNVLTDWLSFKWWLGWGTDAFEDNLSDAQKAQRLAGVGFPWADKEDPTAATMRRKSARLILSRQFNLLNRAHVERTRILRRAIQFGEFRVTRDDSRGLDFEVDVHNATNGHAVPTGFDAERIMFVDVQVRDANGRTIFHSGARDPNGDLLDTHSSYVHAQAPKTGPWLGASDWKEAAGLPRLKSDLEWRPDPFLFSLQSKFTTRNLDGGERQQVLPVNTSQDPVPFVRPSTRAEIHSGRGGAARKHFRTLPPVSDRTAKYRVAKEQLTEARPYSISVKFVSQMVPVNLVGKIASVGFDMNLSAKEVAQRVAFGHQVSPTGERRGGAVTVWDENLTLHEPVRGVLANFLPSEEKIMDVPVSDYPFPHTTPEELAERERLVTGSRDIKEFLIQHLGPHMPELWPGGVPEGLPLLPENPVKIDSSSNSSTSSSSDS